MPVNVLRKSTPRGKGPPPSGSPEQKTAPLASSEDQQKEADLAAKEQADLWEAEEIGLSRWSGGDEDKRFVD
ncbi:MAG: hypothetical protein D6690_09985 [Nitrospirae bacterium]|nr:MAG: hypothetical protein D6690_09985 [Nitrospirota bacterium]